MPQAPLGTRQLWHDVAASGCVTSARPPQVSPHSVSQLEARHAPSAGKDEPGPGCVSSRHCERQAGSPLQPPRHVAKGEHKGSDEQAVDSAQQLVLTHEAHVFVPYGKPQMRTSEEMTIDGRCRSTVSRRGSCGRRVS